MARYIGINHIAGGMSGWIDSSFNEEFKDQEVLIGNGMDITPCQIGDVTDAYKLLKEKIEKKNPNDFYELAVIILETVQDYFGDYSNIKNRMNNYHDLDELNYYHLEPGKVSSLKKDNSAMCVERAMLSQNLLKILGINSFYKASGIIKDGKIEGHAYNLVEYNEKHFVFDTAIPTLMDDKISPIVAEIPKEVFDKISSNKSDIGYSVSVSHFNPLRNTFVDITYDEGRKDIFEYNERIK